MVSITPLAVLIFFTTFIPVLAAPEKNTIILDEVQYTVRSERKAIYKVHRQVFICNEKGKSFGYIPVPQFQYTRIKSIEAKIVDRNGHVLKRMGKRKAEQIEISLFDLYSGDKYYLIELTHPSLPYILDYSYTIEHESLFFWPEWFPQDDIPVVISRYVLTVPSNLSYATYPIGSIPEPTVSDDGRTVTWELHDLPPYPDEYLTAPEDQHQYALHFAPAHFTLEGTDGSFASWESMGAWYDQLTRQQYLLEPASISNLILAENTNNLEKIESIYTYIQDQTRYVAIALGIHGWKPHSAQSIYNNKYGDCKDLSTLFIALLAQNGIEAYPTLILTRTDGVVYTDFPKDQFNHVITFIPMPEETLWVDCTTKTTTIRDLPYQDEGCHVLVVQDGWGKLLQTPASQAADNLTSFEAHADLDENGDMHLTGTLTGLGNSAQYIRSTFRDLSDEDRRKVIIDWLGDFAPSFSLEEIDFTGIERNDSPATIEFECLASRYANISSRRLFLNPSFYRRLTFQGEDPADRQTSVFYLYPRIHLDRITYTLPPNLSLEARPEDVSLSYPFGEYHYRLDLDGNQLHFTRHDQINQCKIEVEDYGAYYQMMRAIEKADQNMIVFYR